MAGALKDAGNAALKAGDARAAVALYTQALDHLHLTNAGGGGGGGGGSGGGGGGADLTRILLSNRSIAYLQTEPRDPLRAAEDARAAIARAPEWCKAHVRLGKALLAAGDVLQLAGGRVGGRTAGRTAAVAQEYQVNHATKHIIAAVGAFDDAAALASSTAAERQHIAELTNAALHLLLGPLDRGWLQKQLDFVDGDLGRTLGGPSLNRHVEKDAWAVFERRDPTQLDFCSGSSAASAPFVNTTLLCLCAYQGKLCAATALLRMGAHPDTADAKGSTPLLLASEQGQVDIVKLLLLGAVKKTPHQQQRKRGSKAAKATRTATANPNVALSSMNERPLWCAARAGHVEIVDILLSHGADIEGRGRMGTTPIAIAAALAHIGVVALLRQRGADTCARATEFPYLTPAQSVSPASGGTAQQNAAQAAKIVELLALGNVAARPAAGTRSLRSCGHCRKEGAAFSRCSGCGVVAYCSKACQRAAWKMHKPA
jgi:hypothetical protein